MPTLSNSMFSVVLDDSGNRAVYSVQPQHLNDRPGSTLAERARFYGEQLAVEINGASETSAAQYDSTIPLFEVSE